MADIILVPQLGEQISSAGIASNEMHVWMSLITDAINNTAPLTGTGSPESVKAASVGRWYVDGTNVYFKATGDGNTGWVLTS